MHKERRREQLEHEARTTIGMIDEVLAKTRLLQLKLESQMMKEDEVFMTEEGIPPDISEEVLLQVVKMDADLDRYSDQLESVYEELDKIDGNIC